MNMNIDIRKIDKNYVTIELELNNSKHDLGVFNSSEALQLSNQLIEYASQLIDFVRSDL